MRLRSLTISENPTCSSREATRKTVGEVVTVYKTPPDCLNGNADYTHCGLPIANRDLFRIGFWFLVFGFASLVAAPWPRESEDARSKTKGQRPKKNLDPSTYTFKNQFQLIHPKYKD